MKTVELLEELRKKPLFTINDLARLLRKGGQYVRLVAYRLKKRGLVKRIERGKYTVHDDPVIFASFIVTPSYISFWTALRIYNMTEQLPSGVMVAATKPKKDVEFGSQKITFTKISEFWGYKKMRYGSFDIFIAEPEKAVVDSMIAKNVPFDEAAKSILEGEYDHERLIEYAIKTGTSSLAKRVGYILEKRNVNANRLLGMADRNYIPLDWSIAVKGRKDPRWKVIVNTELDDI